MLFKIGVLKNFAIFTGNICVRVSFLIKLQASGMQFYLKDTPTPGVFF